MYKFLTIRNKGPYSGFDYSDYVPGGSKEGQWLPRVRNTAAGYRGYHTIAPDRIYYWVDEQLFEIEEEGATTTRELCVSETIRFVRKVEKWNSGDVRRYALGGLDAISINGRSLLEWFDERDAEELLYYAKYIWKRKMDLASSNFRGVDRPLSRSMVASVQCSPDRCLDVFIMNTNNILSNAGIYSGFYDYWRIQELVEMLGLRRETDG